MRAFRGITKEAADAFKKELGIGSETVNRAFYKGQEAQGLGDESTPMSERMGRHLFATRIAENLGFAKPEAAKARMDMGMGLEEGPVRRMGQLAGSAARDVLNDDTRGLWWLLNAFQATGDIITQEVHRRANKDLYKKGVLVDKRGRDMSGTLKFLPVPAGIAINTGLGLMTPFGGAEGYKAAMPSAEDPTKTQNVLGEVAMKYFLGRTGNLLPYDEFKKVRPDVSREEYGRYKAFKFNKKEDWNPTDDGQTTMLGGALKYTNEGIHGPEMQFLGRSLPVTTGFTPFVGAVAGGAAGLRSRRVGQGAVTAGTLGGFGGLAAGSLLGNALEQERRRRNKLENEKEGKL